MPLFYPIYTAKENFIEIIYPLADNMQQTAHPRLSAGRAWQKPPRPIRVKLLKSVREPSRQILNVENSLFLYIAGFSDMSRLKIHVKNPPKRIRSRGFFALRSDDFKPKRQPRSYG
jgi:hypothetical protein